MSFLRFSRRQFFSGWASLLAIPILGRAMSNAAAGVGKDDAGEPEMATKSLVLANKILADKHVLDGYGHVSARDPDNPNRYLLARSMPPSLVEESDLMTFDLDSRQTREASAKPPVERFIHGEIYRARPDVKAIVYCCSPELIPFGATDVPLRPLFHLVSFIRAGVPVFDVRNARAPGDKSILVRSGELGRSLAGVLGNHTAALIRGCGCVVVGSSIPQVAGRSVYLQTNAKTLATTIGFNRPVAYLEADEETDASLSNFEPMWEAWKDEQEDGDDKEDAKQKSPDS